MTITDRDRRLMAFIPFVLILVGYFGWLSWTGKFGEVTRAKAEAAKAEETAPSKDKLQHQQVHVAQATRKATDAAKEVEEARLRLLHTIRCADPLHRAERIHKLTSLLSDNGLVVLEHAEAEAGKDRLPAAMETFVKGLPIPSPPKLHRITFQSRYQDACALVASLEDGSIAIPVGLTMKELKKKDVKLVTDWHEWTLLVWV